jgi:hypothetical protein
MSNHYNPSSSSNDPQHSREQVDALGLKYPIQAEQNLLSPYNSHLHSTTTSPSYNVNSTPGESISDWSDFQPDDFGDDPFFGVDADLGVNRVDSLSSALFNQAYQSLQENAPLHTTTTAVEPTSATEPLSASSTYPLSPLPSTSPNTPSPKFGFAELRNRTTISPHELNTNIYPPPQQAFVPVAHLPAQKLTPDHSGTSQSSGGSTEAGTMQQPIESPRISVSQWENMVQQGHDPNSNQQRYTGAAAAQPQTQIHRSEQDGSWQGSTATGQAGLDPSARQALGGTHIMSLKEQEKAEEIEKANQNILQWQARSEGGSVLGDNEQSGQSYFPHPPDRNIWETHSTGHIDHDEDGIDPVDDTASIRENRLQEGQTYYKFEGGVPNGIDLRLMYQSRHWSDAPAVPRIIKDSAHFQQPATSNEAMMKWNREADAYSLASRAATWGTRRRSEPSIADWESVDDGSFLKKLSISKSRGPSRPRNNSILDRGLDQLAKITRKKSESRMKRSHSTVNVDEGVVHDPRKDSQDSLAPPRGQYASISTPNVGNTIAAMGTMAAIGTGHARSGSVSGPTAQPKSPLLNVKSFIKRARSKSELTSQEKAQSGIADMWQRTGGPPVAVPASVPAPQPKPALVPAPTVTRTKSAPTQNVVDLDDDDEDDDDLGEEDDIKQEEEEETDPIVPNYEGFKAHIRQLNPDMDPKYSWLVSRVAHQQEVRYKNLLNLRVKHQKDVALRNCAAGPHCIALGGNATLIDAKGLPRQPDNALGLQIVTDMGNESDSNPGEGALTDETFPQGVPKPPTKNLPAEFECQLCFKAKKFQKPSDWTKHVHEDVQPFTCTYDKCKESKSFKRKADWVRHENERHRHLEWWVCQVDDCKHPCYRKDNFLQHLVREHKLPEPKHKTKAAVKKTRNTEIAWVMLDRCHHETKNRPQDEPCKFCGKIFATWKKLTVHLAKHMEHISLPILKLVEARVVDVDTIISPVEGIITPVTPIGRTGIDSSPYNLNNISPHNTMGTGFHHVQYTPAQFYHQPVSQPFVPSQPLPTHAMNFDNNIYANTFVTQPMESSHGFVAGTSTINHMDHAGAFGTMETGFSHARIPQQQPQSRGYGSMDSSFTNSPDPNFHQFQQNNYQVPQHTMAQTFSSAPAQANFPVQTMHNVSNPGFDFDPMNLSTGQNFAQQTPMSRAQGSASSYGQSPPMGQQYHYNTHNNSHQQH